MTVPKRLGTAMKISSMNGASAPSSSVNFPLMSDITQKLMDDARADPELAEQLAWAYAHQPDRPRLTLADYPNLRLSSTGAVWTLDRRTAFARQAQWMVEERQMLYDAEKAKGTAPVDILAQIFAQINRQAQDYKDALNWH